MDEEDRTRACRRRALTRPELLPASRRTEPPPVRGTHGRDTYRYVVRQPVCISHSTRLTPAPSCRAGGVIDRRVVRWPQVHRQGLRRVDHARRRGHGEGAAGLLPVRACPTLSAHAPTLTDGTALSLCCWGRCGWDTGASALARFSSSATRQPTCPRCADEERAARREQRGESSEERAARSEQRGESSETAGRREGLTMGLRA